MGYNIACSGIPTAAFQFLSLSYAVAAAGSYRLFENRNDKTVPHACHLQAGCATPISVVAQLISMFGIANECGLGFVEIHNLTGILANHCLQAEPG